MKRVVFLISDTGGGLPSAHRNRIFEAGYTTKRRGWGMGLALVVRRARGVPGSGESVVPLRRAKPNSVSPRCT